MSKIIHRTFKSVPRVAAAASGVHIVDQAGKRYLDASGGAAVSCLGHGHPDVLAALHAQIDKLAYAHTSFFTSEVVEELADHLTAHAPQGMDQVYFVSGGSEAVEAALKLARQYFVESGQPQRTRFVARRQSYHGNTLGALAVGGNEWRRRQFAPLLIDVSHVSPVYEYRDRQPGETLDAYTGRLLAELEAEFQRLGPETVIAFVAETVVGATAGAVPPTPGYFKGVREICNRYGILLIADEVMSGMGRTGTLHAIEQDHVVPDLMTIAKGLGGGYQPIGAVLASSRITDPIRKGSGLFQHGHTYIGHPTAAAAALAVQKVIKRDGLLANVQARGEQLKAQLAEQFAQHPHVGDIRGRGLFVGVELVRDRESKTPFDPADKLNQKIKQLAMENGLLVYPMGGTIDGQLGDHVLLAPPFIVSEQDVADIVERLALSIDQAISAVAR
ncbi:aspartate aminotransferase family protein [Paraburkholderia tropica]|uniref:aspartate aminotransferase family protein n=1 Tax=Paraburkholderia tropica TaxID=92647 RepID=UPI002AB7E313|nr:aspartate aminotransferase family protein [Paraburkholderia tropica]